MSAETAQAEQAQPLQLHSNHALYEYLLQYTDVFDIVRLVDVSRTIQYSVNEAGELVEQPYDCFVVWNKGHRCANCTSTKAFACKGQCSKFEFMGDHSYNVISKYVEIDDVGYVLELVNKVNDTMLFGTFGEREFVQAISNYNEELYVDPLTGANNRRYLNDQIIGLRGPIGLAIFDLDEFKSINDTYGHLAGDAVLKAVADVVYGVIRGSDTLVRYGGDEFIIVIQQIPADIMAQRMEQVRAGVQQIVLDEWPGLRASVSIGGVICDVFNEENLDAADHKLYMAKRFRNCVVLG